MNDKFPFMIFLTVKALSKKLNQVLQEKQIPLNFEQFGLLVLISEAPEELSQQEIANFLEKDKSAILRTIDVLENKGYLQRNHISDDRRINKIGLTEKGREIFDKACQVERHLIEGIENLIFPADYSIFKKVLFQIREAAMN